jgi:hypothetical protein
MCYFGWECGPILEASLKPMAPIWKCVQRVCHDILDFIQASGFPSAIHVLALTHSRRSVVSTLVVAYLFLVRRSCAPLWPSFTDSSLL